MMKRCSHFVAMLLAMAPAAQAGLPDAAPQRRQIEGIKTIHHKGARPRFSPDSQWIVYDRKNRDGFADVYISDLNGKQVRTLTEGKPGIGQRNNGNAAFHPSGQFVVFISEAEEHAQKGLKGLGDPGLGLYCNLWATTPDGGHFWQLTDVPMKKHLLDKTFVYSTVNPVFSPDGKRLIWTERYAKGGHNDWGKWRLKVADFIIKGGAPVLENVRVLLEPGDFHPKASYATAMGVFPDNRRVLVAGNLDGQHEYGMDLYIFDPASGKLTNLLNSPDTWEEGAALTPDGRHVVFMSNLASPYQLDFNDANWALQPLERDYWIVPTTGGKPKRLTFFNEKDAPEYVGKRMIVAALRISPDGKKLAATLGVDFGRKDKALLSLKVGLITFKQPLGE